MMLEKSGMRTHHLSFYLSLAVGAVLAVVLSTAAGLWLDARRPIGTDGIIPFLAAVFVILVSVEVAAGTFGDWIDDRIQRHHAMH